LELLLGLPQFAQAGEVHTPKVGSPERQAICDAARAHVLGKYASAPLPQPIVFKIDHLAVSGNYANMEAIPLLKDGSYAAPTYLPDMAFIFCLEKNRAHWRVIADLSRSDVPEAAEARAIRSRLPDAFPLAVLSATWRHLLGD
jgi:hypothetical protein